MICGHTVWKYQWYVVSLNSLFLNDIFLLDIGELRKMWNSIEFTDYDSEREEEEDDDDQDGKSSQCDRSTSFRNSTSLESGGDADGEEYRPPKPRKGQVAQIPASLEESTTNVSNTDVMNTNVNLGGGEASFALVPASGISKALTINVSDNAVMDVDEAEALLSASPAISMLQQSALKVNNPDAMDCDDEMGAGTAKVEGEFTRFTPQSFITTRKRYRSDLRETILIRPMDY